MQTLPAQASWGRLGLTGSQPQGVMGSLGVLRVGHVVQEGDAAGCQQGRAHSQEGQEVHSPGRKVAGVDGSCHRGAQAQEGLEDACMETPLSGQ